MKRTNKISAAHHQERLIMREIIAILRGIAPAEALAIGTVLVDAGISKIEVPLNSPAPFDSIKILAENLGHRALIGAGTVLQPSEVAKIAEIGGKLIVSPNCDAAVIQAARALGLIMLPGVFTATECFTALRAGASGLKFFPANLLRPIGIAALKAVLPKEIPTFAVGGVSIEKNAENNSIAEWVAAGVSGFGIGSALYKPGYRADQVAAHAAKFVAAYDMAM
ncbi:MAG: 2-dehydro-3-deoxy-6-phosphogalactonate aldolase, partial [Alphaproteobacteria bacterium]|nr:2-dehydro-3-deoxy-6-phosphogalactonate aldolase [Alphaproteobacteria bacterium]